MTTSQQTRQIIELLKHRHPAPQWAHFVELSSGTGGFVARAIDFYALNMWPSKNNLKVAYEVKVSRADFANELKKPSKRQFAETVADECYFVMPTGLVKTDEIPEGWGLMVLQSNGFKVTKRARQRNIQDLPLHFVCAIARRAADTNPDLPAALWKIAGKEVDAAELVRIGLEKADVRIRTERQDAVKEFKANHMERHQARANVIERCLGLSYLDPDVLEAWIGTVADEDMKKRNRKRTLLKRSLERMQRAIDAVMEGLEDA